MITRNVVGQSLIATAAAVTSMILGGVIFYTMRNEHHETMNLVEARVSATLAAVDAKTSATNARIDAMDANIRAALDTKRTEAAIVPPASVTELLPFSGMDPASYKTEVPCPAKTTRTAVWMPAGQSNAANNAGAMTRSAFGDRIVNFHKGHCYIAEDPLLGADGDSGSAWVMLANQLLEAGIYDRIVIAPAAAGGTYMVRWTPGNDLYNLFRGQIRQLADSDLAVTDVLWVHGEAERAATSSYQKDNGRPYRMAIEDLMLASQLPKARPPRFFVGLNSSCPNQAIKQSFTPSIRAAQLAVVENDPNAFLGANIDEINGYADRLSVCHLTASGLEKYVADWKRKILAANRTSAARSREASAIPH